MLLFYFLLGMLFCTERGLRILQIWEYYAIGLGPSCLIVIEVFAICWIFGYQNLELLKKDSWHIVRHVLVGLVVAAIVVIFISDCMNPLKLTSTEQGLAWLLSILPLTGLLVTVLVKKKSFLGRLSVAVKDDHVIDLNLDKIDQV